MEMRYKSLLMKLKSKVDDILLNKFINRGNPLNLANSII